MTRQKTRHTHRLLVKCGLLLLLVAPLADADDSNNDIWTANLYLENDLFGETDQNYTNGLRLSWVSHNLDSYGHDPRISPILNGINRRLDGLLGFRDTPQRNIVISLGQLIYTPETIGATELLVDERPYAGYLYTGIAYQGRTRNRLDTVEVNLGIVGPSALGQQAQDAVHDFRHFDKFQGWHNQLEDEITVELSYEKKRRLFKRPLAFQLEHDFISHMGVALGNVAIYLNGGGEYRLGWDLPEDFGTSAVRSGGDNSAPGNGDIRLQLSERWLHGVHGFISVDTKVVGHDIFLDGNTWKDSHSLDKEYLVADLAIGVSALVRNWKVSYAQVFRSREYQNQAHHHEYGSFSLSYSW